MSLWRSPSKHDNQESSKKASSHVADQQHECRSPFGIYTDSDMLVWLKGLALDPCNRKASPDSARQLLKQSLKVRKLLVLGNDDSPRRKRNLGQFLKGSKFLVAPGLPATERDGQSAKRMDRGDSVSGLTNPKSNNEFLKPQLVRDSRGSGSLVTFENEYQGNQCYIDWTIMDDMEHDRSSGKDIAASPTVETDESYTGLNTLSPGYLNFDDASIVNPNNAGNVKDTADSSDSSSLDEDSSKLESGFRIFSDHYLPRSISVSDTDDSCHHSDSLRSYEQNLKLREKLRTLFLDECPRNTVVPIGPGFQADVPVCTGPLSGKALYGDSEMLRWLGTLTWPVKGRSAGTTVKTIGKGRSNLCSCTSPGSVSCVEHHVHEARLLLQSELGPAFRKWKFDEMGESVSKSWTSGEQRTFGSLMEKYKKSDKASFWKTVFKRFPSKCPKSIMNYYYNVFIPRRMSLESRSSVHEIVSDDDESDTEEQQS